MKLIIRIIEFTIAGLLLSVPSVSALKYSSGQYGACQFSSCNITLSLNSTLNASVTPASSSVKCSVVDHTVSVATGSTTGYTLSFNTSGATTDLTGSNGGTIATLAATPSSPSLLAANKWGYRLDGASNFGAGPTTTGSSIAIPSVPFAGVPASSSPQTLKTTSVAASPADPTDIYYGICLNTSLPNGTYTNSVDYTAIIN